MRILAIETSQRAGSIAFADGDHIAEHDLAEPADQTLMPLIVARCDLGSIEGIAVGLGPGMFTSMRVGIATAKTLAFALGLRVAGVASLDLIARAAGARSGMVAARLEAGRREVYAATYRALPFQRMSDMSIVPADEFAVSDGVIVADGAPRAGILAAVGQEMFERGETKSPNEIEPLYVRRTDAEIDWEARGGIARPNRVKARGE